MEILCNIFSKSFSGLYIILPLEVRFPLFFSLVKALIWRTISLHSFRAYTCVEAVTVD